MKMRVTFELPLPESSNIYFEILAKTHGYIATQTDETAMEFVLNKICCKQVSSLFHNLIVDGLAAFYGSERQNIVEQICTIYQKTHSVIAETVES